MNATCLAKVIVNCVSSILSFTVTLKEKYLNQWHKQAFAIAGAWRFVAYLYSHDEFGGVK